MKQFRSAMCGLVLIAALALLSLSLPAAPAHAGSAQTFVVLFNQHAVPADAATLIANAGGTLVYSYSAIGVAIARSDNDAFRANLLKDNRVENASSTNRFGVRLNEDAMEVVATPSIASAWGDPLSNLQ